MPSGFQILLRASLLFSLIQITHISMNAADLASAIDTGTKSTHLGLGIFFLSYMIKELQL